MLPSGNDAAVTIAQNFGLIIIENSNINVSFKRIELEGDLAL